MTKWAIWFPGQGSQQVGMGKALTEKYTEARQVFEEANDALGFDLTKLCFEGPLDQLTRTEFAQPAILATSIASFRVFQNYFSTVPDVLAGHSLGELSALTAAGTMSVADAVRLVNRRGQLMQEAAVSGGAMAAIQGLEAQQVDKVCTQCSNESGTVVVSNYNNRSQTVISGESQAVERAMSQLEALGGIAIPLKVSAPFHSPYMEQASLKFQSELQAISFKSLAVPVLSNVTAKPYVSEAEIIPLLTRQMTSAVQWQAMMDWMKAEGVTYAVEMAPNQVLTQLAARGGMPFKTYTYNQPKEWEQVPADLRNAMPAVTAEHTSGEDVHIVNEKAKKFVIRALAIAVCTKNSNWNDDEYRRGVIEPYREVQQIQEELDRTGAIPTRDQMDRALHMLCSVFETKRTPDQERDERFEQLFDETDTKPLFTVWNWRQAVLS
ncbi:ACP S-malonyltransferase [Paenibacillus sp. UMB4589-SE434]|uniref:ACP S-malonyltransferase n=1 Tax=Paenibacillus sp. UMB4589-SE434 TaxID=3046314 RepID=UPI00254A2CBC|nr:ACP S-malonyltransferase [Paenibacillus sp. UMB4589-SE434]MDK8180619.1 ACP S-malonyltransferase [Paenibacillus sp. UMB4589-SE434]